MNLDNIVGTISSLISIYALKFVAAIIIVIVGKWLSRKVSNLLVKLLEKNEVDVTLIGFLENYKILINSHIKL